MVDDSLDTLEVLRRNLEAAGYRVYCATGVPQAIHLLGKEPVDVVVTDLKMPGVSGIDLVRHVRENLKETEVLMITGYPSVEGAVSAMRTGAADYLAKPFTSTELLAAIGRAIDRIHARWAMQGRPEEAPREGISGLLGDSEAMQRCLPLDPGARGRVAAGSRAGRERHGDAQRGAGAPPPRPAQGHAVRRGRLRGVDRLVRSPDRWDALSRRHRLARPRFAGEGTQHHERGSSRARRGLDERRSGGSRRAARLR